MIMLTLAVACAPTQQVPPAAAPEATVSPVGSDAMEAAITAGRIPDLSLEMSDHYLDALRLEIAVFGGDLDGARRQGTVLANMKAPEGLPDPQAVEPYLAGVRAGGERAAAAADLPGAARALGDIAHSCGGCHTITDGGPRDKLPAGGKPDPEASGHLDGVYWLGYALFAPDDAAWTFGLQSLKLQGMGATDATRDAAVRFDTLTTTALAAKPEERPALWADLLLTCSGCHGSTHAAPTP